MLVSAGRHCPLRRGPGLKAQLQTENVLVLNWSGFVLSVHNLHAGILFLIYEDKRLPVEAARRATWSNWRTSAQRASLSRSLPWAECAPAVCWRSFFWALLLRLLLLITQRSSSVLLRWWPSVGAILLIFPPHSRLQNYKISIFNAQLTNTVMSRIFFFLVFLFFLFTFSSKKTPVCLLHFYLIFYKQHTLYCQKQFQQIIEFRCSITSSWDNVLLSWEGGGQDATCSISPVVRFPLDWIFHGQLLVVLKQSGSLSYCIVPSVKLGGGAVVQGCLSGVGLSLLVPVKGTLNASAYMTVWIISCSKICGKNLGQRTRQSL